MVLNFSKVLKKRTAKALHRAADRVEREAHPSAPTAAAASAGLTLKTGQPESIASSPPPDRNPGQSAP